jgi:hypothetical protein
MDRSEFASLLQRVADGWNSGDPGWAADCFTRDAIYLEPPDLQRYDGRQALLEFFRGDGPEPRAMSITWHHAAYDPDRGLGFGEYTFSVPGVFTAHGVAVLTTRDGLIASWREYQYRSDLSFADFAGPSIRS